MIYHGDPKMWICGGPKWISPGGKLIAGKGKWILWGVGNGSHVAGNEFPVVGMAVMGLEMYFLPGERGIR